MAKVELGCDVVVSQLGGRSFINLHKFGRRGRGRRVYWTEVRRGETVGQAIERAFEEYEPANAKPEGE